MKIHADTYDELQEAIDSHKVNGWFAVERERRADGMWTAVLVRERKPDEQHAMDLKDK